MLEAKTQRHRQEQAQGEHQTLQIIEALRSREDSPGHILPITIARCWLSTSHFAQPRWVSFSSLALLCIRHRRFHLHWFRFRNIVADTNYGHQSP